MSNRTLETLNDSIIAGFCEDNANIPRVFVAQFGGVPLQGFGECNGFLDLEPITITEGQGNDVTTIGNVTINVLESEVRNNIMENRIFGSILIQVTMRDIRSVGKYT